MLTFGIFEGNHVTLRQSRGRFRMWKFPPMKFLQLALVLLLTQGPRISMAESILSGLSGADSDSTRMTSDQLQITLQPSLVTTRLSPLDPSFSSLSMTSVTSQPPLELERTTLSAIISSSFVPSQLVLATSTRHSTPVLEHSITKTTEFPTLVDQTSVHFTANLSLSKSYSHSTSLLSFDDQLASPSSRGSYFTAILTSTSSSESQITVSDVVSVYLTPTSASVQRQSESSGEAESLGLQGSEIQINAESLATSSLSISLLPTRLSPLQSTPILSPSILFVPRQSSMSLEKVSSENVEETPNGIASSRILLTTRESDNEKTTSLVEQSTVSSGIILSSQMSMSHVATSSSETRETFRSSEPGIALMSDTVLTSATTSSTLALSLSPSIPLTSASRLVDLSSEPGIALMSDTVLTSATVSSTLALSLSPSTLLTSARRLDDLSLEQGRQHTTVLSSSLANLSQTSEDLQTPSSYNPSTILNQNSGSTLQNATRDTLETSPTSAVLDDVSLNSFSDINLLHTTSGSIVDTAVSISLLNLDSRSPSGTYLTTETSLPENESHTPLTSSFISISFPHSSSLDSVSEQTPVDKPLSTLSTSSQVTLNTQPSFDRSGDQLLTLNLHSFTQSSLPVFSSRSESVVLPFLSFNNDVTSPFLSPSFYLPQSSSAVSFSDSIARSESAEVLTNLNTDSLSSARSEIDSISKSQLHVLSDEYVTHSSTAARVTSNKEAEVTAGPTSLSSTVSRSDVLSLQISSSTAVVDVVLDSTSSPSLQMQESSSGYSRAIFDSVSTQSHEFRPTSSFSIETSFLSSLVAPSTSPSYATYTTPVLSGLASSDYLISSVSVNSQAILHSSTEIGERGTSSSPSLLLLLPTLVTLSSLEETARLSFQTSEIPISSSSSIETSFTASPLEISSDIQNMASSYSATVETLLSSATENGSSDVFIATEILSSADSQSLGLESRLSSEMFIPVTSTISSTGVSVTQETASPDEQRSMDSNVSPMTELNTSPNESTFTMNARVTTATSFSEMTSVSENIQYTSSYLDLQNSQSDIPTVSSSDYQQPSLSTDLSAIARESSNRPEISTVSSENSESLGKTSSSPIQTVQNTNSIDLTDLSTVPDVTFSFIQTSSVETSRLSFRSDPFLETSSGTMQEELTSMSINTVMSSFGVLLTTSDDFNSVPTTQLSPLLSTHNFSPSLDISNPSTITDIFSGQPLLSTDVLSTLNNIDLLESATTTIQTEIIPVGSSRSTMQQQSEATPAFVETSNILQSNMTDSVQPQVVSKTNFQTVATLTPSSVKSSEIALRESTVSVFSESIRPTETLLTSVGVETMTSYPTLSSVNSSANIENSVEESNSLFPPSLSTSSPFSPSSVTLEIPDASMAITSSSQFPPRISSGIDTSVTRNVSDLVDISASASFVFGSNSESILSMTPSLQTGLSVDNNNGTMRSTQGVDMSSSYGMSYPEYYSSESSGSQMNTDLMRSPMSMATSTQIYTIGNTNGSQINTNIMTSLTSIDLMISTISMATSTQMDTFDNTSTIQMNTDITISPISMATSTQTYTIDNTSAIQMNTDIITSPIPIATSIQTLTNTSAIQMNTDVVTTLTSIDLLSSLMSTTTPTQTYTVDNTNTSLMNTELVTSPISIATSTQTYAFDNTSASLMNTEIVASPISMTTSIQTNTLDFTSVVISSSIASINSSQEVDLTSQFSPFIGTTLATNFTVSNDMFTDSSQTGSPSLEETSSMIFINVTVFSNIPTETLVSEDYRTISVSVNSSLDVVPVTTVPTLSTTIQSQNISYLFSDITPSSLFESEFMTMLSDSFSSQSHDVLLMTSSSLPHIETSVSGYTFASPESGSDVSQSVTSSITFSFYPPILTSPVPQSHQCMSLHPQSTYSQTLTPTPVTQVTALSIPTVSELPLKSSPMSQLDNVTAIDTASPESVGSTLPSQTIGSDVISSVSMTSNLMSTSNSNVSSDASFDFSSPFPSQSHAASDRTTILVSSLTASPFSFTATSSITPLASNDSIAVISTGILLPSSSISSISTTKTANLSLSSANSEIVNTELSLSFGSRSLPLFSENPTELSPSASASEDKFNRTKVITSTLVEETISMDSESSTFLPSVFTSSLLDSTTLRIPIVLSTSTPSSAIDVSSFSLPPNDSLVSNISPSSFTPLQSVDSASFSRINNTDSDIVSFTLQSPSPTPVITSMSQDSSQTDSVVDMTSLASVKETFLSASLPFSSSGASPSFTLISPTSSFETVVPETLSANLTETSPILPLESSSIGMTSLATPQTSPLSELGSQTTEFTTTEVATETVSLPEVSLTNDLNASTSLEEMSTPLKTSADMSTSILFSSPQSPIDMSSLSSMTINVMESSSLVSQESTSSILIASTTTVVDSIIPSSFDSIFDSLTTSADITTSILFSSSQSPIDISSLSSMTINVTESLSLVSQESTSSILIASTTTVVDSIIPSSFDSIFDSLTTSADVTTSILFSSSQSPIDMSSLSSMTINVTESLSLVSQESTSSILIASTTTLVDSIIPSSFDSIFDSLTTSADVTTSILFSSSQSPIDMSSLSSTTINVTESLSLVSQESTSSILIASTTTLVDSIIPSNFVSTFDSLTTSTDVTTSILFSSSQSPIDISSLSSMTISLTESSSSLSPTASISSVPQESSVLTASTTKVVDSIILSSFDSMVDSSTTSAHVPVSTSILLSSFQSPIESSSLSSSTNLVDSSTPMLSTSPSLSSSTSSKIPSLSTSIQPSSTSSVIPSSSASISTASPPVTVPTIENSGKEQDYWISVGLLVKRTVNVSSAAFKTRVEQGLANAYFVAAQRKQEIDNGTFQPLRDRKRRKRLATAVDDQNVQVEVTSIERQGSTSQVDVAHVVQQNGRLLEANQAVDQLSLLDDQELAIELGIVVGKSVEPYIVQPATDSSDDSTTTTTGIIVGASIGCVAVIVIVIIIICYCCGGLQRCCHPRSTTEMKISDIRNSHYVNEIDTRNQGYVDDESPQKSSKSLGLSSKKGKYSLQQGEEDPLYASIDHRSPVKAGKKKKSSPQKIPTPQSSIESEQDEDESVKVKGEGRYKKKKQNKPKMQETDEAMEMQSVYESQIASLQNNPTLQTEHYSGTDFSATGQPTIEIERDLLDNADEERKKNKQRIRERKMKEKGEESHLKVATDPTVLAYENAQKEIDKVLGPRQKGGEEGKKEKKSSKSKHHGKDKNKEKEQQKKEDEKDEDKEEKYQEKEKPPESLDEARQKMHKLLDDAFSLFSQSRSSMGSKVHPSQKESSDEKSSPVSQRSRASHSTNDSAKELIEPKPEEKKHTPLFVERSHGAYDNSGLISWSPYRASDESALISLPTSQTNLNADPPQREIITTSTFSESLPSSLRPNYYTTLPGEPIVIKMQDLDNKSQKPEEYQSAGQAAGEKEPRDVFSEPYYGMSSYQEIPKQSAVQTLNSNGSAKNSSQLSPRNENGNYIDVRAHTAPGMGEKQNNDVLDVIKQSVQPGASPEPLITSLRDELMSLSMRRNVSSASNPKDDKDVHK